MFLFKKISTVVVVVGCCSSGISLLLAYYSERSAKTCNNHHTGHDLFSMLAFVVEVTKNSRFGFALQQRPCLLRNPNIGTALGFNASAASRPGSTMVLPDFAQNCALKSQVLFRHLQIDVNAWPKSDAGLQRVPLLGGGK